MPHLSFLIALLVCASVEARTTKSVNTATYNLATTYDTSFPQRTATGLVNEKHLSITNETATRICCNPLNSSTAPSSGDGLELCVPASSVESFDEMYITGNIYCRSDGAAAITSGYFHVKAW